jgi:Flp pilus assembly protein TadB
VIIVEPLALDRWRVFVVVLGERPRVRSFEVTPRRALEVVARACEAGTHLEGALRVCGRTYVPSRLT